MRKCRVCGDVSGNRATHMWMRQNPGETELVCKYCVWTFEHLYPQVLEHSRFFPL